MTSVHTNAAWCWFADPRAVYNPNNDCTYVGLVTELGSIKVGVYNHSTNSWTWTTLHSSLQIDDHANPSIQIRSDGRIVVYYSAHAGSQMYYRVTTNPNGVSNWNAEQTVGVNTSGSHGYTYPCPVHLPNAVAGGKTFLIWRGGNFQPTFSTTTNWTSWSTARTIFNSGIRPYFKVIGNNDKRIHFAVNDGNPENEPSNNLYHFYFEYGVGWHKSDGTFIKESTDGDPLTPEEVTTVYDASTEGGRSWVWDIALDENENPVIAYSVMYDESDHRYRRAKWNGSSWDDEELVADGGTITEVSQSNPNYTDWYSGGVHLDHSNPDILYTSERVSTGVWQVKKREWDGTSWTVTNIIPSPTSQNVRPFVPVDHDQASGNPLPLIWMNGDYNTYTTYNTDLVSP